MTCSRLLLLAWRAAAACSWASATNKRRAGPMVEMTPLRDPVLFRCEINLPAIGPVRDAGRFRQPCRKVGASVANVDVLIDYPFADRLYQRALEVIERLSTFGPTVTLSDGDMVFQPRKVRRSGLWGAVSGGAVHLQRRLQEVQALVDAVIPLRLHHDSQ